jgi:LPS-assembly protein
MPSYFDTGNVIFRNLKVAIDPLSDSLFTASIQKMGSYSPRPIHWLICLLCISFNALAETSSPTLNAIVDSPPLVRKMPKSTSAPSFIETSRTQGHYERNIESVSEIQLRGVTPIVVAAPVPPTPTTPIGPAVSIAKKIANPNKFVFAETGRAQGHQERGVGLLYEDELRGAESENKLVYIDADRLEGTVDEMFEAIGNVEVRSDDKFIAAERIRYLPNTNEITVEDTVRIERRGGKDLIEGSELRLNLDDTTGQLSQVKYRLQEGLDKDAGSARGSAKLLMFEGEDSYRVRQGSYTTCPEGDNDWMLLADDLKIDSKQEVGTGRHVTIAFKGVPIAYTPWVNFSLDTKTRKSGLLSPEMGYTVRTGAELTIPFYWNIAPNIDATFSARTMSNRGIMMQNELRYIEKKASGNLLLEILPSATSGVIPGSTTSDLNRYYVGFKHEQRFGYGWTGNIDFNKVSDKSYFTDLAYDVTKTSQANMKQEAALAYQSTLWGDGSVNFKAMAQSFQNIRGNGVYKRLPEFTLNVTKPNVFGAELDLKSSWASFSHQDSTQITGNRLVLNPSISAPIRREYGYVIPKFGIHHTSYDLNTSNLVGSPQPDRTLPIFSLDSGLIFDRDVTVRGERFNQTLEPRAMYVYVPYRDQTRLPNFDSTFTDFSFVQIFNENRFSGSDRINDANRLTLGLTSRFLEAGNGKERLSLNVGQVLHFTPTRVTALGIPQANSRIDLIAGVTGHFTPQIKTDTTVQFDQGKAEVDVVRSALSYSPQLGRVINLGYRYSRFGPGLNLSANPPLYPLNPLGLHQADISAQWRFNDKWQAVGKINYSLLDSRTLERLVGIEYNACCWSLRFMYSQIALIAGHTTQAGFLQLELNGLMGIGISPLKALQQRIPGYTDTSPTSKNSGGSMRP